MKDNLPAALEATGAGFAVFPIHSPAAGKPCDCGQDCTSPSKHPWTRNGFLDASVDQLRVASWWKEHPTANVGIATGKVSGVVVVDVDPRHEGDKAWFALMAEHEYEHQGPIAATGGGGWHYFFKWPGELVQSRSSQIAEGIDVKGDGGYIVAPPSLHASGVMYQWCEGRAPGECGAPDTIPDWLLKLMRQKPDRTYETTDAGVPGPIPEGRRHDWLVSRAGSLRARNFGEKAIFAALMAEATERFDSPWDETKVAKIAADAGSWPLGEATILPASSAKSKVPGKQAYVPHTFTVRELRARVYAPVLWAIPGLVPAGLAILAGRPKLGKSWMALDWVIAVAQGYLAMGELGCDTGEALMLALEDREQRLQGRVSDLVGAEDGEWADRLHFETHWPHTDEGGLNLLDAWLGQHPETRVVVIDTFAMFKAAPGPNQKRGDVYAEDYAAAREIKDLADRHGVAIVIVTHYNKSFHDDWINAVSGSSGLTGAADTLIGLERPRGVEGQKEAVLHVTGRDVDEADWGVEFEGGRWKIIGDAADVKKKREHDAVVQAITELTGRGSEIVGGDLMASALNVTKPAAMRRLQRAETAGVIERVSAGFYRLPSSRDLLVAMSRDATNDKNDTRHARQELEITTPVESEDTSEKDKEPRAALTDNATNGTMSQMSRLSRLSHAEAEVALPTVSCRGCGTVSWQRRVGGQVLCTVCRPAVKVVT